MTKTLIIDPGHGGKDGGARGFGVDEKDWNLKMSLYQYIRLKALGVDVSLTRREDNTLEPVQRVARIKNQYDLCLSNHWNAFNGEARGVEGIYSVHGKPDLATDLVDRVVAKTGLPKRRVFKREIKKGVDYYYMHRLTGKTETVILEYGFIDHPTDFNHYADNTQFQLAAEAVIEGLCLATGHVYRQPEAGVSVLKSIALKKDSGKKRLVSHHAGKLRFYNKPSWSDKDVFGHVTFGQGFPTVVKKLKVGRGEQYQVKNSKGDVYYITASPAYVNVL
ncbi:N-acetylmuramoyl-L-alanine amidase family protein [Alkalibacterium sp. f15]|uniref:N-acetylmuramoyl-L-alanine amidase family protein n=1 Tax=Alkalibacterium sp. f15 TaxID=3414029 RepID=UPI003BF7B4DE